MKKPLQGIALILFGLLLMMYVMIDPWVPIFGSILTDVATWVGVICGILGIVFALKRED